MKKQNKHNDIRLGNRWVGPEHPPYIVAEMSGNHNQSVDKAIEIIEAASQAGADAIKFQTYTADTLTIDVQKPGFVIEEKDSLWHGQNLHELYHKAHTPWAWHKRLFEECKKRDLNYFSSPFDATAVDFLEDLDVPFYKIASFENTNHMLIKKVAATGKPVIVSTGMASMADLEALVKIICETGQQNFILLKCTSTYPADPKNSHLLTIPHLRETFDCQVGLSDHTAGIGVAIASVALGATLIEKHFTLSRSEGGVDAAFSIEPHELKTLVVESKRAYQALGQVHYGLTEDEKDSLRFRRSLYLVQDVKAGDILSEQNMRAIRPGYGLEPKFYDEVLGKRVLCDATKGTPLDWDMLADE